MHDERTCVVQENIHTISAKDHWKFRGGGGAGFKGSNFRGVGGGGGRGKNFLKGDRPRTKH